MRTTSTGVPGSRTASGRRTRADQISPPILTRPSCASTRSSTSPSRAHQGVGAGAGALGCRRWRRATGRTTSEQERRRRRPRPGPAASREPVTRAVSAAGDGADRPASRRRGRGWTPRPARAAELPATTRPRHTLHRRLRRRLPGGAITRPVGRRADRRARRACSGSPNVSDSAPAVRVVADRARPRRPGRRAAAARA